MKVSHICVSIFVRPFRCLGAAAFLTVVVLGGGRAANAAVITVDTTADDLTAGDGACTLREAVENADADTDATGGDCAAGAGADTIVFDASLAGGTIQLASNLRELVADSEIVIDGPGADQLSIRGEPVAFPGYRVLGVSAGAVVTLNGLTLRDGGGFSRDFDDGGNLVRNDGVLEVNDCVLTGARGFVRFGWALFNAAGAETVLRRTLVTDNGAFVANTFGGAIYNHDASPESLTILDSTISGNRAQFYGGVVGALTLINSTVADNVASSLEGKIRRATGIAVLGEGALIVNSTIANNHCGPFGRLVHGIKANSGTVILNSVVVNNRCPVDRPNFDFDLWSPVGEVPVVRNSVVEKVGGGAIVIDGVDGNVRTSSPGLDPAGLQDNGGPLPTIALVPGSPAIDRIPAGVDGCGTTITTDQRGAVRPEPGSTACDAGAVEFGSLPPGSNQAPIAVCQDVTVPTDEGLCSAEASIDAGSSDPDGDPLTITQDPPGPYGLGDTLVTLTATDDSGASDSCQATVTVEDRAAPIIFCNAPATITPPDAPISFSATAEDNCSVASVEVTGYDCWMVNRAGKRVDKTGSCVVSFDGDTLTVEDSGGVGDHIEWTVTATDGSGNPITMSCSTDVVNPGKGKGR